MEPTSRLGGDLFAMLWDPGPGGLKADDWIQWLRPGARALTRERVTPQADGTISLRSTDAWTAPGCAAGWSAAPATAACRSSGCSRPRSRMRARAS
jgi:gamma-glutamyltranspeptidase